MAGFIAWTALIRTVDVRQIGPENTRVGLAALNGWFHAFTGVHFVLYTITDWLGLVPVAVCLGFALIGAGQLIHRKSLGRVDRDLILLGVYYGIGILCYILFEMIPVNYRPVLIEGRLEASYPSSTTLLVLSVMPTLAEQAERRCRNAGLQKLLTWFSLLFSAFMVTGRLVSGVHWLTDIVGAVLLGNGLFTLYRAAVSKV